MTEPAVTEPADGVAVIADGAARVVVIDRPDRRNALDLPTLTALRTVAMAVRRDRDARGIVLTGGDCGVFLSGGDLKALQSVRSATAARSLAQSAHAAVDALRAAGVPVIAAVNGDAYGGGCELAAACDYRVCVDTARFHWVHARFGVTTGWGGASNLLDLVTRGTAARWLLTGRPVTASEARTEGFVDEIVAVGDARRAAVAFIADVARHPRVTVRRMLTLVRQSGRLSRSAARALELEHFGRAWATKEHHDAVAAFLARTR